MEVKKHIAVFGGGASSLLAAYFLSKAGNKVAIYEKGKTLGRKFLVAGKGGFNLTNEAEGEELVTKYTPHKLLEKAIKQFGSNNTRDWLKEIGIETYIGSSGRVFPLKGIKPVEVLKAITNKLFAQGVVIYYQYEFIGFNDEVKPIVRSEELVKQVIEADNYLFALGGASWSVTGSNGDWLRYFRSVDIKTIPFEPSNCGIIVDWSEEFISKFAGEPLKNIAIKIDDKTLKGEALISDYGLEGNIIYPYSSVVREELKKGEVHLILDLKPNNTFEQLKQRIKSKLIKSKDYGKLFNFSKVQLALIKQFTSKEEYLNVDLFLAKVKSLEIPITGLRAIEEAISTVGGIDCDELTSGFSLKKYPHIYLAGEMINWDAPTGGFLLQGCFSSAYRVYKSLED